MRAESLANQGEPDKATQFYRAVLEKFPENKRAIEGLKSLERPKPNQEQIVLNKSPTRKQINALIALYSQGRLQEALVQGTALAERYPDVPLIPNILGIVNTIMKRPEEAVTNHTKALQLEPNYAEAHNNLGNALKALGKHEEAVASYSKALQLKPENSKAHFNLGSALKALGKHEEAIASYTKALQLKPDLAEAHNSLGTAFRALEKHEEAIASYTRALQIKPDYAEAHYNLGIALNDLDKHEEATASYTKALQLKPDFAEAHNNLGTALSDLGRHEEAAASYSKALQLKPDFAEAHNNLGLYLTVVGKHDEAIASYSKALQIKPDFAEALNNLGTIKNYETDDPQVAQMLELIANPSISENDKMHLSFALGKAYDDIGDAESSFQHLLEGNRLRKKELGYDIISDKRLFNLIKSTFSADKLPTLEEIKPITDHKKQPIFIVGMPRSGTTLVDQILASHSQVYGAGELDIMNNISIPIINNINKRYFDRLSITTIISVSDRYFSGLNIIGSDESHITDKMPLNFRWIGLC